MADVFVDVRAVVVRGGVSGGVGGVDVEGVEVGAEAGGGGEGLEVGGAGFEEAGFGRLGIAFCSVGFGEVLHVCCVLVGSTKVICSREDVRLF